MIQNKLVLLNVVAAVYFGAAFSASVAAADRYQYTAQFLCGENINTNLGLVRGNFATAITIQNPTSRGVTVESYIAVSFPETIFSASNNVFELQSRTLGTREAREIDCEEILAVVPSADAIYSKGVLVVESNTGSLNVIAVLTAAEIADGISTSDIQSIPAKQVTDDVGSR